MYDDDENVDRGGLGWRAVACGPGIGVIMEEDLSEGQSWMMVVSVHSLLLEWYCLAGRVLYINHTCQLEDL